jgi:hypothetical protein
LAWAAVNLQWYKEFAMFQTEYEFTLPCGYLDQEGALYRDGVMRRATAADEILPLKDPRVVKNPAYLVIILLSRVVTHLGGLVQINPGVIESLYATDLAFLQQLYNEVNRLPETPAAVVCPECRHAFEPEAAPGGLSATLWTSSTGR